MFNMKSLAISAGLILAGAAGAMADQPADRGSTPGLGWGRRWQSERCARPGCWVRDTCLACCGRVHLVRGTASS